MILTEASENYDIFSDALFRDKFEQTIRRYEKRHSFRLLETKYSDTAALMLIRISDVPTAKIMQSVLTSFSKYLSGCLADKGKKFKDRYKAFLIRDEFLDEIISAEMSDLLDKGKTKRFLRKKGKIIGTGFELKRTAAVESGFEKAAAKAGIAYESRDARHALAVLLRKHTLLTNRQISQKLKLSESAVSKILSRETRSETEKRLIELCEHRIKKNIN